MFKMKNLIARLIVFIVIGGWIGTLGYAFYMGGWKAISMFLGIFGGLVTVIVIVVLLIWAFRRVFVGD